MNEIKIEGIISLLKALSQNKGVEKLSAESNRMEITRGFLYLIGVLVIERNSSLKELRLA